MPLPLSAPVIALETIARMKCFPDDKINRVTLVAAIEIAKTTLAAVEAVNRVSSPQEGAQNG